jgi:hypothetical protein
MKTSTNGTLEPAASTAQTSASDVIHGKRIVTVNTRILNSESDFTQKRLSDAKALRKLSANGQEQLFQRTINLARVPSLPQRLDATIPTIQPTMHLEIC